MNEDGLKVQYDDEVTDEQVHAIDNLVRSEFKTGDWVEDESEAAIHKHTGTGIAMSDEYLIWWTNQNDCERIVPLETWPTYLASEFVSREGRNGRGRLWRSDKLKDAPEGVTVEWDAVNNWLCRAASDAGGIVIKAKDIEQVQYLPGFVTTFAMTLPT